MPDATGWLLFTRVFVLEVAVGWERRPEDEKMLAKIKAGRARAFFKGSSTTGLLGLGFLAASGCRVVERGFLRAGPPSSADERGRGTWGCRAGLISCERVGRWGC